MASSLKDKKRENKIFALHVGDSGSGKSCASGSYAGDGLTYFMDMDFRIDGVKAYKPLREKINKGNIVYDQFPTTAEGLERAHDLLLSFKDPLVLRKLGYRAIIFSTITTLDDATFKYGDKYAMPKDKDKADNLKIGRFVKPGMDHYAVEIAILEEFINILKALSIHCVVEAHWAPRYISDGKSIVKTIPDGMQIALRDKVAPTIPIHFNEIFFFEHKTEEKWSNAKLSNVIEHKFLCTTRNNLARTTFTELPDQLDWTNKNFWEVLMSALEEESKGDLIENQMV